MVEHLVVVQDTRVQFPLTNVFPFFKIWKEVKLMGCEDIQLNI